MQLSANTSKSPAQRALFFLCLMSATGCGDCGGDTPPPDTTPQCSTDTQCAVGKRCASGLCVVGCAAVHCPSGQCHDTNTCAECINNSQCGGSTPICNLTTQQCSSCATGSACQNTCMDLSAGDRSHCGGCATACTPSEFCSGSACRPAEFRYLCDNHTIVMARDGLGADDMAGQALADAMQATCSGSSVSSVDQSDNTVIDSASGAPLLGSKKTLIISGGPFWQHAAHYLEVTHAETPVYFETDGLAAIYLKKRSDHSVIVGTTLGDITSHHDFFVLQTLTSDNNGTLTLMSYGFDGGGTVAAGYYFAHTLLPNRASNSNKAVVVEWTDSNNNSTADASDSYVVRAQF